MVYGAGRHILDSALGLGAALLGPYLMYLGFRAMRVRTLIQNTPTSRIRSMAMGLVELDGSVAARSRVTAPFSGKSCAYWEVEIATRTGNSRGGTRRWATVHRNRSGHPFYLTDETGTALVYPQGADCKLNFGVQEETGGFGVPDPYSGYMEQQGLALRGVWSLGPMRFRERVLEDDAKVYVLGRAFPRAMSTNISWDDDALEATGTESPHPKRVSTLDQEVRGVIRRGPQDPTFVISLRSEKNMTFEYGAQAVGGMLAGPLVTLFGVWCLLELAKSGHLFH